MKKTLNEKAKNISVRGARLHNLQNVNIDIPRNKLTVITGVSGSGKSTLAFDTIYAEGQRRFVESLSSYARQFLERMHKPECDSISGIPPAIAIEQQVQTRNPRSTVGTTTEIYDYLRLFFGRIGETICHGCGRKVTKDSPQIAVKETIKLKEGSRIFITFPFPDSIRDISSIVDLYREAGYYRLLNTETLEIIDTNDNLKDLNVNPENLLVLVDRLVLKSDNEIETRITDSIEAAFKISQGKCIIIDSTENLFYKYSSTYECTYCSIIYEEPDPKIFSFNNPHGACPKCQGFGKTIGIDENLVIPDLTKSLRNGAIHPFRGDSMSKYLRDLLRLCEHLGINAEVPYIDLPTEHKEIVWKGYQDTYIGINGFFDMLEDSSHKTHYRILMSRYRGYTKCKACNGSRIRTSGRQVFIGDKNIPELINMPLEELSKFFNELVLSENQFAIAEQILNELKWRTNLLVEIGLEYITLSRLSHTLSGGESQRIALSTALGSSLVGTLYVLDEPSIGLHPRDTGRLLKILYKIRNLGNTVIVVEHDPDIIKYADFIADIGPGAGYKGGNLVFAGTFKELIESKESITGQYLNGSLKVHTSSNSKYNDKRCIHINKARENNLKIDNLDIPKDCMVVVTGVSGSGKSTLVKDVIYNGMKRNIGAYSVVSGKIDNISGYEKFSFVELVDQSPIGKSSRSTPATYTKAFDTIRDIYATTIQAKQLGWRAGHFSFNVPGGRCEECQGEGSVTVEMQFLPDITLECEACKGTRYKKEAREILYKGKSVVDILNMTVVQALEFFDDVPKVKNRLITLNDVGLGYLQLGQPSNMLSGGESQRIKLAASLDSSFNEPVLYIFDEPTTGLHLDDISKLIKCFYQLVEKGHSVIIIEHNIHVIAAADYIIDLGPEAGEKGGMVIAKGPPSKIIKSSISYTGKALKEYFDNYME